MSEKKFTPTRYHREAMARTEFEQTNEQAKEEEQPDREQSGANEEDPLLHELLPPPEEREFAQELLERKRAEALVFERFRTYFAETTLNITARALWDEYREGLPAMVNELKREVGAEAVGVLEELAEAYKNKSIVIAEFADRAYETYSWENNENGEFDLRDYDCFVFTELFASKPQGGVYIEFLPTSVYIECADPRDYRTVYQYREESNNQQSSGPADPEMATAGFKKYLSDAGLSVTMRNMRYAEPEKLYWFQETRRHEDAHALYDEILDLYKNKLAVFTESARKPLFSGTNQKIERELPRIMEQYAEATLWRAIDEILAFMRTGMRTEEEIKKTLREKGGLYDYYRNPPFDYETIILKPIDQNPQAELTANLAETVVREMEKARQRHGGAIGRMVDYAEKIATDANITHEELYAWLAIEAYKSTTAAEVEARWKKLANAARVGYVASLAKQNAA